MVEWGGHHGGWGGFGPPSYIVKKCPAVNNKLKCREGSGSTGDSLIKPFDQRIAR